MGWYDRRPRLVRDLPCGDARILLEIDLRRVQCKGCGRVKNEQLDFLADNPFYTKRFAYYVGRRCRQATIKDVAEEFRLHWETIKTLEMQYMRVQLAKAGTPGPKAIGIDEIVGTTFTSDFVSHIELVVRFWLDLRVDLARRGVLHFPQRWSARLGQTRC